jgi:hypothetical protein
MPGVEPIHDWHGNRPDFPSVEYGRQEKNPQMIPPIQIGPISAKAMVRTDSGSGGKGDER